MKLTDITEKKSTYWRTSEKKPKLSKPSKKHQQRHPGQSRGMVGDSVEFDDKPVDEMYDNPEGIEDTMNKSKKNYLQIQLLISQAQAEGFTSLQDLKDPQNLDKVIAVLRQKGVDLLEVKRGDNKYDSVAGYIKRGAGGAALGGLTSAGIGAGVGAITGVSGERFKTAMDTAKQFGKTGAIIGAISPPITDLLTPDYTEPREPLRASDTIPDNVEDEYHRLAKVNKVFAQLFINAYHKTKDMDQAFAVARKQYSKLEPKIESVQKKLDEAYSGTKSVLVNAVMSELEKKAMKGDADDIKFLRKLASLVGKRIVVRDNGSLMLEEKIPFNECPKCRGEIIHESELEEAKKKKKKKRDACYHKVKSRYKVWPSAYASGALVKCRKVGAKNWGNKSKKKKSKK